MARVMDATTLPCEQCGQPIAQSSATYSTAGQLVCPTCAARGLMASTADRAAASRRSMRIVAIVSAALVIGVPSLMIAAGAGEYVSIGLIVIGVILLAGGRQALRMAGDPGVKRGAVFVMLAGVGTLALGAVLQGAFKHR